MDACNACGSISIPMTSLAPSFKAAIARIPEPQPKSTTVLPATSMPSSQRKHRAVVGCVPVPNARPGSSITFTASGSGTSRQLGHIHKRSPNFIGWKLSIHSRSQSLSSSGSRRYLKSLPSTLAFSRRLMIAGMSSVASNNPTTWVSGHNITSPGLGSYIGVSLASTKVTA